MKKIPQSTNFGKLAETKSIQFQETKFSTPT